MTRTRKREKDQLKICNSTASEITVHIRNQSFTLIGMSPFSSLSSLSTSSSMLSYISAAFECEALHADADASCVRLPISRYINKYQPHTNAYDTEDRHRQLRPFERRISSACAGVSRAFRASNCPARLLDVELVCTHAAQRTNRSPSSSSSCDGATHGCTSSAHI